MTSPPRITPRDTDEDRYFTDDYQVMPREGYTALFTRMLDHPLITVRLGLAYREVFDVYTDGGILAGDVDEVVSICMSRVDLREALGVNLIHDARRELMLMFKEMSEQICA